MGINRALSALLAAALLVPAAPALAMIPQSAGWDPKRPPSDLAAFEDEFPVVLYSVGCGDITATGWSADAQDDPSGAWDTMLVTTAYLSAACAERPGDLLVRQGNEVFVARPWRPEPLIGLGTIAVEGDGPAIDWDFVPTPRVGQWVGIDARSGDGEPLPMLERRITEVSADTFVLDQPVGGDYLGAPVVDNMARVLGVVARAGTTITGTPQMCGLLFECTDASRVWWDITAPSAALDVKATPGKRSVTVTWKPAADDGGAEVAYWYRIDQGRWIYTEAFKVVVRARKGQSVTVSVGTVNQAGPGPIVTKSARAR